MKKLVNSASLVALAASLSLSAAAFAQELKVQLSGDQENPPVKTAAKGSGTVTVGADRSVKVRVTTTGIEATAAHIHMAAGPKENGGVIIPFKKEGDAWVTAQPDAKFTEAQYEAFKAGNTYVNVHSKENPGGEIRAQLKP